MFLDRQKHIHATINAVVQQRRKLALEEARVADKTLVRLISESPIGIIPVDALPPFFGVPCSIKECFAVDGMSFTAGVVHRRGVVAVRDAPAVERLREAGFIVLCVTNTSELCMWWEASNTLHGRTNNPYNSKHVVGGSSGGEACVVSAMGAPVGLGSDIGGSIRIPANYCGVFGHKPTSGVVPNFGQYPCADGTADHILTTGPITRYAQDLWPMLMAMKGPHPDDAHCKGRTFEKSPESVEFSNLRVFHRARSVGPSFIVPRPDAEVMDCVLDAAVHMQTAGSDVKACPDFALFNQALDLWSGAMNFHKDMSFRQHLSTDGLDTGTGGRRTKNTAQSNRSNAYIDNDNGNIGRNGVSLDIPDVRVFRELSKWLVGKSDHTFPALGLCIVEDVMAYMPGRLADMASKCATLLEELEDMLGDDGVLLFVCMPRAAPGHGQPITPGHIFSFAYCSLFNALGLPSTAVPMGLNKAGLPLGIQVVAKRGNDHLCVAVALELERAFGGWVDMSVETPARG